MAFARPRCHRMQTIRVSRPVQHFRPPIECSSFARLSLSCMSRKARRSLRRQSSGWRSSDRSRRGPCRGASANLRPGRHRALRPLAEDPAARLRQIEAGRGAPLCPLASRPLRTLPDRSPHCGRLQHSKALPHARNLPLPVISRKPSSRTIRRAACGVTSSVFTAMPAETSGFAMTNSISSGSFDDVRRPASFRSIIFRASARRSCSFNPISAAAIRPWAIASSLASQSRCRRRSTGWISGRD